MNPDDYEVFRCLTRRCDFASERGINMLEKDFGFKLPEIYRQFLLEVNGGRFEPPPTFPLPDGLFSGEGYLFSLYSLDPLRPVGGDDIRTVLEIHEGRIARSALPIGDDGDNLYMIFCDGVHRGAISIWIRDDEWDHAPDDNCVLLASSFDGWLRQMQNAGAI